MTDKPVIQAFFDVPTNTVSYLVSDPATKRAAIIDPVWDYDPRSGRVSHTSADAMLKAANDQALTIDWILETHAHADHLSSAHYLKTKTGAKTGIGEHITLVQAAFAKIYNLTGVSGTGGEFDHLFADGDVFEIGSIPVEVLHVPGHTPADIAYKISDAVFVGDTLFMPDYGTARTDFPGGDAMTLYRSIRRLLALPGATRLFMCHDYEAPGRTHYAWETTVAHQRAANIHINDGVSEEAFIAMRRARDKTLSAPVLLWPSVQVNIRAGALPPAEGNGTHYLKTPIQIAP